MHCIPTDRSTQCESDIGKKVDHVCVQNSPENMMIYIRAVGSESLKDGKSRIKSEKSNLISY